MYAGASTCPSAATIRGLHVLVSLATAIMSSKLGRSVYVTFNFPSGATYAAIRTTVSGVAPMTKEIRSLPSR